MATRAASRDRLAEYHRKRDFSGTPEPRGDAPPEPGSRFVVQRHRARRLHYDFRLELDGVLVSWAVPKGPTLDPDVRRLAQRVEDHPLEYFDFEGVIPKGSYGGGDVIVWDWGVWRPDPPDKAARDLEAGELHFDLDGEKLHGRFALIRRDRDGQWLMVHKHDDASRKGWKPEDHPESVLSGRTTEEVAADPDRTWSSDADASEASRPTRWPDPWLEAVEHGWNAATDDELQALDALGASGRWQVAGREVRVTNLDKELFDGPDGGAPITKRELLRYYTSIAPYLLPYLAGRAVNLRRAPDGQRGNAFWAKAVPRNAPSWLHRWTNPDAEGDETRQYAVLDEPAALAFMANQAAFEMHPWTSLTESSHEPTWAYIDVDPGTKTSFEEVVELTRLYRAALDHLGVEGRPKVTGQRGIQIWVPIRPGYSFDETRDWVEVVSKAVGSTLPDLVSWAWRKDEREGRARLDYTQNAINKTLVAPFSIRLAPGAPVSVPLEWNELDDPDLRPDRWNVRTVLERLEQRGDPLRPLIGLAQNLPSLGDDSHS